MRMIYLREGTKQRNSNFFNHNRALPASFYDGTTGIQPIDQVIKKVIRTGYAHHIERLMVLGNFMLLNEYQPHQIYEWFMEVFVDSYDWVMVPNVYGMSQFSDGGLITTKPYFSGSNYLLKMSDYPKLKASPETEKNSLVNDNSNGGMKGVHANWQELWDALFWRFIDKNRQYLQSNPRLGMMVITYDKMNVDKRERLDEIANRYLD
jgi:deoxyribodipyrimidine photolyase-related protein